MEIMKSYIKLRRSVKKDNVARAVLKELKRAQDDDDMKYTEESLDISIEDWLQDTFGFDIDFEVDDALSKLEDMKLLNRTEDGFLSVLSIQDTLAILDEYWDNIYDY